MEEETIIIESKNLSKWILVLAVIVMVLGILMSISFYMTIMANG